MASSHRKGIVPLLLSNVKGFDGKIILISSLYNLLLHAKEVLRAD
jgi:hypothetical protein